MRPFNTSKSASLAAAAAAHTVNIGGANAVVVSVDTAPAANAVQLIFEGRIHDTGSWLALSCRPTNSTTSATLLAQPAALSAVPAFGWFVNTAGIKDFRVRVVSLTAGAVTVSVNASEQPVL